MQLPKKVCQNTHCYFESDTLYKNSLLHSEAFVLLTIQHCLGNQFEEKKLATLKNRFIRSAQEKAQLSAFLEILNRLLVIPEFKERIFYDYSSFSADCVSSLEFQVLVLLKLVQEGRRDLVIFHLHKVMKMELARRSLSFLTILRNLLLAFTYEIPDRSVYSKHILPMQIH